MPERDAKHPGHGGGRRYLGGQRRPQVNALQVLENAERLASMGTKKTPLEILLELAQDETLTGIEGKKLRAYCASQAAPYMHQRKPVALQHSGADGKPLAPPSISITFGTEGESIVKHEVLTPDEAAAAGVPPGERRAELDEGDEAEDVEVTMKETGT